MKLILQVGFLSLMLFFGSKGYSASECDAVVDGSAEALEAKALEAKVLAAVKAKAEAEIGEKNWIGAWIPKVMNVVIVDGFSSKRRQYWLVDVTIGIPFVLSEAKQSYIAIKPLDNPDSEIVVNPEVKYSAADSASKPQ